MKKLRVMIDRIKDASFARMKTHIREIHKESGRSSLSIFLDMIWCTLRYGVGYLEYHVFGFAYIRGKKLRKTFMTMNDNLSLVRRVNQAKYRCIFKNKLKFWERFSEYTGRAYLNLEEADAEALEQFVTEHQTVFAKPADDFGGHGIKKICACDVKDYSALYEELKTTGNVLVEEQIVQHAEMDRLNPSCINTLRMVTLVKDGKPHLMYTLVRVGDGTRVVDNISSGGMYAPVWEDGKIAKPAFCDSTGQYYNKHPLTGTDFVGFAIPDYDKAVELVLQAALVVEQIKYVGWDVALSDHGPVLVEGNVIPGYDMCQNYHHLRDDKQGILDKFLQYYPRENKREKSYETPARQIPNHG